MNTTALIQRIINYCENQPSGKWLLVRHIFDYSFLWRIPSKKGFDFMLSKINDWAAEKGMVVETANKGDWDFIRFIPKIQSSDDLQQDMNELFPKDKPQ